MEGLYLRLGWHLTRRAIIYPLRWGLRDGEEGGGEGDGGGVGRSSWRLRPGRSLARLLGLLPTPLHFIMPNASRTRDGLHHFIIAI